MSVTVVVVFFQTARLATNRVQLLRFVILFSERVVFLQTEI